MSIKLYGIIFCLLLLSACSKTQENEQVDDGRTYFSIVDFAKDEWAMHGGQAYGIVKKVYFNGKVDSVYTNAFEMDWSPIFKEFFATDISDKKYIGQYNFTAFDDTLTFCRNFFYEANNPKLYTRTVQITSDFYTDKVKSIYIEAEKNNRVGTKNVKLFYIPMQSISIQEWETSKTGQEKELRVVYEFL